MSSAAPRIWTKNCLAGSSRRTALHWRNDSSGLHGRTNCKTTKSEKGTPHSISLNIDLAKCYRHAHFTTLPPVLSRGFFFRPSPPRSPAAPMGSARSRRRRGKPPGHPAAQQRGKHPPPPKVQPRTATSVTADGCAAVRPLRTAGAAAPRPVQRWRYSAEPTPRPPVGGGAPQRHEGSEPEAPQPPKSTPPQKKLLTTPKSCAIVKMHRRGTATAVLLRGPTRKGWPSFFLPITPKAPPDATRPVAAARLPVWAVGLKCTHPLTPALLSARAAPGRGPCPNRSASLHPRH